jgi:ADP-heptose:LPS heptosyltransferase
MKILFITASRIGDAVLSTGLLAWLVRRYPHCRITVACGAPAAALFACAPQVERVIAMTKRKRSGHWLDLWRNVVGTGWSLVVDLRGSAIAWAIPALRRRILWSKWQAEHRIAHLASVLAIEPQQPVLWSSPQTDAEAARLIPAGTPVLGIGPTANWGAKQWPAERFLAVAQRLTSPAGILPEARIAVFGGPAEREAAAPLLDALPSERCIDLVGTIDLPTAFACLKRMSFYFGNDSGLMHIAAAAGIPTLGLFGPSSELFYGPCGPRAASIRGPRSFEDICHAPDYDYRSPACLMLDLTVERVAEAAEALYRRTSGS